MLFQTYSYYLYVEKIDGTPQFTKIQFILYYVKHFNSFSIIF